LNDYSFFSAPQLKRDPLGGPDDRSIRVKRFVRGLRFLARLMRPSTWRVLFRAALPNTTATAEYGDLSLEVIDVRSSASRNLPGLVKVVTDALRRLSLSGQGFGELVTSHLHSVLAVPPGRLGASWAARAYGSTFEGPEGTNGHYLACKLIWAATVVRQTRDAEQTGRQLDHARLQQVCSEAQRRFLQQFDHVDEWIEYMGLDAPESGPI